MGKYFIDGFRDEMQKLAQSQLEPKEPDLKKGESRVTTQLAKPTIPPDPATGLRPGESRVTTRNVTPEEKNRWRSRP